MSIASINFQKAKSTSKAHMSRDKNHKITYLLDPDSQENEYKTFLDSEKYLADAEVAAKKLTGRKMQQKAIDNFTQEAVINLEKFHTVDDVKKVFNELKKEFGGFEVFQIAVHRDEGYFYNLKEDLEYRPNRDIFFNDQKKKFYLDSEFKKEVDLNQFEKRYNYHAHVLFSKFDMTTGKNPRLKKSDMSKIQTISAKALGMQRGELFSKAKRMSHWQLKAGYDKKRDEKKVKNQTLAKQKDLKSEIKNLRAELQELGAVREDYAKLEQVNKELRERIKQKELTEEELKQEILTWRKEAICWEEGKKYKDLHKELSEKNEMLEKELERVKNAQKEQKRHESMPKEDKNDLKAVFDAINEQNRSIGIYEAGNLEQNAKKTEQFNSAWIFKSAYESKGEIKKSGLLNKSTTVTFKFEDLEKLYDDLKNHDAERTEQFKKAMELFRKVEKSLKVIFEFIKNKISPQKSNREKRGFRR